MPYIKQEYRSTLDNLAEELFNELNKLNNMSSGYAGNINYFISKLLGKLFNQKKSYSIINELIGALECTKFEFYRRIAVELEQIKIKENGDLEEYDYEKTFRGIVNQ